MVKNVSFSRTPEQFTKYSERGIANQISAGNMTEQDGALIRGFVDAMRVQNGAGDARAYKLTNSLSNVCRFIKTLLMDNSMADINTAVLKIKNGMKITSNVMKPPLPDGIVTNENTEIHKIMINGQEYYDVRRITGPLSQDTKRDYIVFLKRFYLWAIDEGYCNLPADKIKKIKPAAANKATKTAEQILTKDGVIRMIKACNGETGTRDKAMLSVLYEAGLRINELAGLQWSDLKFEGSFIKINVCSKTGIPRYVPLTASREYLSEL